MGTWIIVGAALVGVVVLCMGRLSTGPDPSQLYRLGSDGEELFAARVLTIEANSRTLVRTEVVFFLQAVGTVVGIGLVAGGSLS